MTAGLLLVALLLWLLPSGVLGDWSWRNRLFSGGIPGEPPKPSQERKNSGGGGSNGDPRADEAANRLLAALIASLSSKEALQNEALLTFKTEEAYRRFLARANAAGLNILGSIDGLRTARVAFDSLDALRNELRDHSGDYDQVGANYYVHVPGTPTAEERAAQQLVGFGDGMLASLGVNGDISQWGKGVQIAILDSGVSGDPTFGSGRVKYLDIGFGILGTGEGDGHGTAVAALAAGASQDAMGPAPAADLLSIKVTGVDGLSDIFTLSSAILKAVDAGSHIINISLGAYETSSTLISAIDYASAKGVVIVSAAGNDQAAQLTWPAADPRVISVGAIDALEQQVAFSNSGENLKMTAPGYGLNTAWLDNQRIVFDGTSGSSPIVAGGIAAILSQSPGLTATQAWEVLQYYSSDGGAPGQDPNYGYGILNLGWAMSRADTTRVDSAVSSQYFNTKTNQMEVVVQNRSGMALSGMTLNLTSGDRAGSVSLPSVNPGAIYTVSVPIDISTLNSVGNVSFRSTLNNPNGTTDVVPVNNQKASTVYRPGY